MIKYMRVLFCLAWALWALVHVLGFTVGEEVSEEQLLHLLQPTSRSSEYGWMNLHQRYVQEVEAAKGQKFDLLVYGDSITEAFRGTSFGQRVVSPAFAQVGAAWDALIAKKHRASVFSISGDKAMHLLWRLRNGEGPQGLATKVAMVMIGTNDIGHLANMFWFQPETAALAVFLGVRLVVEEVAAQAPGAVLVLLSLPPLQPGWSDAEDVRLQALVDRVNEQLEQYAVAQQPRMQYADCTSAFLEPGGERRINRTLMPDGVHPMGAGAAPLAECVQGALEQVLAEGASAGPVGRSTGEAG